MRIAAVLISILVALIVAEIALRVFGLVPTQGLTTVTESEYRRLPGLMSPNLNIELKYRVAYRARTVSLGYRGQNFPRRKPNGERRVVMIGDSFTWGEFVENNQTLPAQLERFLNQRCNAVRVVNGGVGGTTILGQDVMAQRSLAVEPDVIVLVYYENDLRDLVNPYWLELQRNRQAKSRFPLSILYPALRSTALWHLGLTVRGRMRQGPAPQNAPQGERLPPQLPPEKAEEMRAAYVARLKALADTLKAKGVDFVFATFPASASFQDSRFHSDALHIVEAAEMAGIKTVDFSQSLRASGLSVNEMYLLPVDDHPRPKGYSLAASQLSEFLLGRPAFREGCVK
ncbi:MAG TPA: GDSL-type esterase/lipase family protein [Longimicrobiales bacterium]